MKNKTLTQLLYILIFVFFISSCKTNDYDLKDNIDLELSLGGDSLSIPLIKSKKVYLSSLLDSLKLENLIEDNDTRYSFRFSDTFRESLTIVDEISISPAPIAIDPIRVKTNDLDFEPVEIESIQVNSSFSFPKIDKSKIKLPEVNEIKTFKIPTGTMDASRLNTSKSDDYLFKLRADETVNQIFDYEFAPEIDKIQTILLDKGEVLIKFDKTTLLNAGISNLRDKIALFKIEFPKEFIISSPQGNGNPRIANNTLYVENLELNEINVYEASLKIDRLDFSSTAQDEAIYYNADVNYSLDYHVGGDLTPNFNPEKLSVGLTITAKPILNDLHIKSDEIEIDNISGTRMISETIQVKKNINKVNTINFQEEAYFEIRFEDPALSPFELIDGNCTINLPKQFKFKPTECLNTYYNTLVIPYNKLFETTKIEVESLELNEIVAEATNNVIYNDEIKYDIQNLKTNSTTVTVNEINSMQNKPLQLDLIIQQLIVDNASFESEKLELNAPEIELDFKIEENIYDELEKIYTLDFKESVPINFDLKISNLPTGLTEFEFESFTIEFPNFLKFEDGGVVDENNKMIINEKVDATKLYKKTAILEKIDFGSNGLDVDKGKLILDDKIKLNGNILVSSKNLNSKELDDILIEPKITIGNIQISTAEIKLNPILETFEESFDVELPESLSETNLSVHNSFIELEIGNSLDIDLLLDIEISSAQNPQQNIKAELNIKSAEKLGELTWSRFRLANDTTIKSEGHKGVKVDLQSLLKNIANDNLNIAVKPKIIGDKQVVDLSVPASDVVINYTIGLPLEFADDFVLSYTDSISDMAETLVEIMKFTHGKVQIIADIENTIPLGLQLSLKPLHKDGTELQNITIKASGTVSAGTTNAEEIIPSNNRIILDIEGPTKEIENLDKLLFNLNAKSNSTVSGIPLKGSQYIDMSVKLKVPKGIKLDMKED